VSHSLTMLPARDWSIRRKPTVGPRSSTQE
jgi:hypothetical protein